MSEHNPAYGNCMCPCHGDGDNTIVHCVPCCSPADDETVITPADTHVNLALELGKNTFASRIILTAITDAADNNTVHKLAAINAEDDGLNIIMTANGHMLNFLSFAKRLEENIDKAIDDKAKEMALEMVAGKFDDISELALDLETRLRDEVNKRLEDWEDPV